MEILQKVLGLPRMHTTINRMMTDARRAQDERRSHGRMPYFQPVMIQLGDSPQLFSAFTRDVSPKGVGLLHWMPIEPQEVNVLNNLSDGSTVRLRVEIAWCVSCGEGWYISGGRFVDAEVY